MLLAGGLDADCVPEALDQVRPFGVDASSGLEREPGIKDPDKVRRFVAAVRAFDAALEPGPDATGHFGPYGGRFVPETLIHALDELTRRIRPRPRGRRASAASWTRPSATSPDGRRR